MKTKIGLLLLMTILLYSCGETAAATPVETETGTRSAVTETVETENSRKDRGYPAPDTTGMDFGGEEIHFSAPYWSACKYYFTDSLNGDSVNDAAFERMTRVNEALNVKITYEYDTDGTTGHNNVLKTVRAGDDVYNAVFTHCIFGIADYVTGGYLYPLEDLPYVDFAAPWWNKAMIEDYKLGGHSYYAVGDLTIQNLTTCLFNKTYAKEYDLPDQYQLVRDGKWTLDRFFEEARLVSVDMDGDGVIGDRDKTGFSGGLAEGLNAALYASGERCTVPTEDGFELSFYSEKTVKLYEKLYDFFTDGQHSRGFFASNPDGQEFSEGMSLFTWISLSRIVGLRDRDIDFGILPMPKYDEAQTEYKTFAWTNMLCVPTTVKNTEAVGMTLEMFAYESADTLTSAYNDILIKGKSARDEESLDMLDILYAGTIYDVGTNLLGFDTGFTNIFYCFSNLVEQKKSDIASYYTKNEKSAKRSIEKLLDKIKEQ